jgi:NAD-dependent DNA ligase
MHDDHRQYRRFTTKSSLDKALKTLIGIAEGIAIDARINEKEVGYLADWVEAHDSVKNKHPFNELIPVIGQALEDGVLSEEERYDVLWLCEQLAEDKVYYGKITVDLQRLHGILAGIIADGVVTEEELKGLTSWLAKHEHLRDCWPYEEICSTVTAVLTDGKIDDEEQRALQQFFAEFIFIDDDNTITNPPSIEEGTIVGVCATAPEILFEGSVFCFTGASSRMLRTEMEELAAKLGGGHVRAVSKKVDYLVIGAEGNPCWAYACYGRKVEHAVRLRKEGHLIVLVHENDFHDAVADQGEN